MPTIYMPYVSVQFTDTGKIGLERYLSSPAHYWGLGPGGLTELTMITKQELNEVIRSIENDLHNLKQFAQEGCTT